MPAPSDTICRVCWVVDLRATSIRRSIERVRTYVPSVSPTKAKRTSIDDWRLSFDRFHKLFNERVVKVSKGRSRAFCEFCVDICLLNDGQLILLVVMGSFASLHCRCRSFDRDQAGLGLGVGSSITPNYSADMDKIINKEKLALCCACWFAREAFEGLMWQMLP